MLSWRVVCLSPQLRCGHLTNVWPNRKAFCLRHACVRARSSGKVAPRIDQHLFVGKYISSSFCLFCKFLRNRNNATIEFILTINSRVLPLADNNFFVILNIDAGVD